MKKISLLICLFAVLTWGDAFAQLPAVTLKTIDGQSVKMDTLTNGGKPFIIDFFATWCKPCIRELDAIHGWEYEVLLDSNEDFKRAFGVQMIPYTMIVDAKGNVAYKHIGYTDGDENELIEKIRELIAQ